MLYLAQIPNLQQGGEFDQKIQKIYVGSQSQSVWQNIQMMFLSHHFGILENLQYQRKSFKRDSWYFLPTWYTPKWYDTFLIPLKTMLFEAVVTPQKTGKHA